MTMAKNHPDYIKWLVNTNDRAVERAILAIYSRQTEDERSDASTKHSNGVGFSGTDAGLGSYYASWINSGKRLTGKHLVKARLMALKYTRQLVEIATEKMEIKAAQEAIDAAMQAAHDEAQEQAYLMAEREAIQQEGA